MNDYLSQAIYRLKPNSKFSYSNRDYSTINWDVLDGEAPTQKQIDDVIKLIKAEEASEVKSNANAKSALLAKLGITEDEAKLLLS